MDSKSIMAEAEFVFRNVCSSCTFGSSSDMTSMTTSKGNLINRTVRLEDHWRMSFLLFLPRSDLTNLIRKGHRQWEGG